MRKSIALSISLLIAGFIASQKASASIEPSELVAPAPWAEHQAVLIGYFGDAEVDLEDEESRLRRVQDAMIDALAGHVPVVVLVEDEAQRDWLSAALGKRGHTPPDVTIEIFNPSDQFIRDPGPVFVRDPASGEVLAADFNYSNYRNVPPAEYSDKARAHEAIDRAIAERLGLRTVKAEVAIEGGAIESNGAGTVMFGNLIARRNPHLTRAQIDAEMRAAIGAQTVLWLEEGVANDPLNLRRLDESTWGFGTGGHIDQYARFVDENTVMLAWVPEDETDRSVVHRITAERMRRNEEILLAARDHRGKPFEVIRVPIPIDIPTSEFEVTEEVAERVLERTGIDLTENLGETHRRVSSAGYLNFVVTNGIVLVPDYRGEDTSEAQTARDAEVQAIFAAAFPDREIIGIDPTELNWMGGGMHCVTVEVPKQLNPEE